MGAAPSHFRPVSQMAAASPAPHPVRRKITRNLRWGIAAGLLLAIVFAAYYWRSRIQNSVTFQAVPVEQGFVQAKVTATGNLNAVVEVLVSSQVSGNIKALYADWNSRVKKGQLVALIDPEVFQAQLDQASASARAAHAATLTAKAQLAKARADHSAAVAGQHNAQAVAAKDLAAQVNARGQWERAQKLFAENILSRQDYDLARANYDAASAQVIADRAQIMAAERSVESAQASVEVSTSQLASAQAQELQAQAGSRQAQINLDRTRITAPVDGTVVARRMDVGQTVASTLNPPTIFEIAQDLTKMQVDTNVDESDIGKIAVGQHATFLVDSYPNTMFQGVVSEVRKAPIITQNVVTYDVVISLDNSDLRLFPGMTANVTILTQRLDNTLKLLNAALRFRPSESLIKKYGLPPVQSDKPAVYVLSGGRLKAVPVIFGISDGRYTAVSSSVLEKGDEVVVRASTKEDSNSTSQAPRPMMPRM
ncbi:MAG: efflux RND transporter periplasmic adaptor subunit [Terracidiphilus sp.]